MNTKLNINRNNINLWLKKIVLCIFSLFCLGIASAFTMKAELGADPITVFYEGLSETLRINVGLMVNIINITLMLCVFFVNKKYISIGTLLYVVILGRFVNIGVFMYDLMNISGDFLPRFIVSIIGCFIAFIGLGVYMTIDIGIDPWTALAKIVSEKSNKSFRLTKTVLDLITLIIGMIFGGKFGIITIFCALVGGPIMQKTAEIIDKLLKNVLKLESKN